MGSFDRGGRGGGRSFGGGSRGGFSGGRSFGNDRGPRGDRPMFQTTCSNCGKECEVPFRPTNGKPVYCSDCFEKMGPRREDSGRSDYRAPADGQNKAQLDMIVTKLDKIIRLLEPKVSTPVVVAPVAEGSEMNSGLKVEKVSKVKKVASKKK